MPKADVITSEIKVNLQNKIVFQVSNHSDSTVALGQTGAEKLLGKGDMYFKQEDKVEPTRIQGAFISDEEVDRVVNAVKRNGGLPNYNENLVKMLDCGINNNNQRTYKHFNPYAPLANKNKMEVLINDSQHNERDDIDFMYVMDNFIEDGLDVNDV